MNHYKSRFLSRLAKYWELDITMLTGAQIDENGLKKDPAKEAFPKIDLIAIKDNFHLSLNVYSKLN